MDFCAKQVVMEEDSDVAHWTMRVANDTLIGRSHDDHEVRHIPVLSGGSRSSESYINHQIDHDE